MNGFERDMVKTFLKTGKVTAITEYAKIKHPSRKKNVVASSYKGSEIRVYSKNDEIHLLYPEDVSEIQMEAVADAIEKGTIFDDAEALDNHTDYLMMKSTPCNAMTRNGIDQPKHLKIVLSGIIGRMSDDGTLEISVADMTNGKNYMDQLKECPSEEVNKLTDHYLGTKDHYSLPNDLKDDIAEAKPEIDEIKDVEDEEPVDDDDFEDEKDEVEDDDKDDEKDDHFEEAFFSKKPKRLKKIHLQKLIHQKHQKDKESLKKKQKQQMMNLIKA